MKKHPTSLGSLDRKARVCRGSSLKLYKAAQLLRRSRYGQLSRVCQYCKVSLGWVTADVSLKGEWRVSPDFDTLYLNMGRTSTILVCSVETQSRRKGVSIRSRSNSRNSPGLQAIANKSGFQFSTALDWGSEMQDFWWESRGCFVKSRKDPCSGRKR